MSPIWPVALFGFLLGASPTLAQTPAVRDEASARLQALRIAAPLAATGAASSVAAEEAAIDLLATKIDGHLEAFWAKNAIKPTTLSDDAEYLRRVSLDLMGRIPSVTEVRRFLADPDPRKREKKVAELLNRAGHFNYFTTVLRQRWVPQIQENQQLQRVAVQFESWLGQRLRENAGMDKLVEEMLTAPTLFARGRNAVMVQANRDGVLDVVGTAYGFNQANEFKPENVAASVSRLFMGVKMECAQCHDHPFAPISREQFWETAAFFADLQPVIANLDDVKLKREIKIQDADPKKVRTVQARFFDDTEPRWKEGVSPRATFASWLVAAENPYFARNAVQRMWAHFFGLGFIDPIDEPGPENMDLIPDLVSDMAKEFANSKFDNRFLIKAITRTKVYQLSSRQTDPSQANPRYFARMNVKAMTAEQVFDSIAQATGFAEPNNSPEQRQIASGPRRDFMTKFASNEKILERQTSILQALTLMNGKLINDQTSLERSHFVAAIVDAPFLDANARIEALYLAVLSRLPTDAEMVHFGSYVDRGGSGNDVKMAYTDVFWALLNSSEFILNH